MNLNINEMRRYSRQMIMDGFGEKGQLALKSKSVLCIGAGGLGSPVLTYMAAAGVGRISIVDFDTVDISNLNRQVLFRTAHLGKFKAEVAKNELEGLNSEIRITALVDRISADNILQEFTNHDLIIDCTDNFDSKYLINDAAILAGRPFIGASIHKFAGQIGLFNHDDGPCYQCLFPTKPSDNFGPNCSMAGVIGSIPGIMGALQATEAVKFLLSMGNSLSGRLLIYDGLNTRFEELCFEKDLNCLACSRESIVDIHRHIRTEPACNANEIDIQTLSDLINGNQSITIIDVRSRYLKMLWTEGHEAAAS